MPLYFAYGANMDVGAMRLRCRSSKPQGIARLADHRVFIMPDGFASVRRSAGSTVHGLLWALALADVPSLDAFEEVGAGKYRKTTRPVLRTVGAVQALIYVGWSLDDGRARPGYLERVIAAGTAAGLPPAYLRSLGGLRRAGTQGPAFVDGPVVTFPVAAVRPRFATPWDRT